MRDKQIEEMRNDLLEIFDEEYGKRRVITADFTAVKMNYKGYRKASDVAREIIEFIEDCLNRLIDIAAPSKSIANFIKIIKWHLCIKIEKKYESEGNNEP